MKLYIVKKCFDNKVILQNFYGEFPKGKTTGLVGPSGVGKTTVMRILSGLDHDYSGAIEDRPEHPVFLFQEDRLVQSISVLSNLKAVNPDEAMILEVLEALGLKGEEQNRVSSLSGGMQRRVAIARMLLLEGDCYFLDEPFTGLDKDAKMKVATLIKRYTAGQTVVVVTHVEEDLSLLDVEHTVTVGG